MIFSHQSDLPEEKLLKVIKKEEPGVGAGLAHGRGGFIFFKAGSRLLNALWRPFFIYTLCAVSLSFFFFTLLFPVRAFTHAGLSLGKNVEAAFMLPLQEKMIPPLDRYVRPDDSGIFFNRAANADSGAPLLDSLKNISLIGILVEEPMQAIIKDKQSGNVFYLKKGESLGDMLVAEIMEGKIIVEYKGEKFEIYL